MRITGTITSALDRGFCFATDGQEKFYVHVSNVLMPENLLRIGLQVSFDARPAEPGTKYKRAMRVRLAE